MAARILIFLAIFGAIVLLDGPVQARDRFERGRTLVQQRCAPCRAMGWRWAPTRPDPRKLHDLSTLARRWSPSQVCTWMSRPIRRTRSRSCAQGTLTEQDRLDMMFYLYRRAQGPILAPKIERPASFRPYQGKALRRTLAERRATVVKQRKAQAELERMRRLTRVRSAPPRLEGAPRPAAPSPRGGR